MDSEFSKNIDDYAPALGRLIMACSKLDSCITNLIAVTTGMNILHAVVTVHNQQFSSKVDALTAILKQEFQNDAEFKPIIDMISQAKKLSEFRNKLVHAIWSFDDVGTATITRFSARGKLTRSKAPVDIIEIVTRSNEAFALAEKMESFREHLQK